MREHLANIFAALICAGLLACAVLIARGGVLQ